MECLFAHDAEGEISLVDVVDADLHVLLVLYGVAMIDVVEVLIVKGALDEGLGFYDLELVFVDVLGLGEV